MYERDVLIGALKTIAESDRFLSGDTAREALTKIGEIEFSSPEPMNHVLRVQYKPISSQTYSMGLVIDPDGDMQQASLQLEQAAKTICGFIKGRRWESESGAE